MNDENRPPRGGDKRKGPRKPGFAAGKAGEKGPRRPREDGRTGEGKAKPFARRDGDGANKTFAKRQGESSGKPFVKRDGDAPDKPYARSGDTPAKPFSKPRGERSGKPFARRDGDAPGKPFVKRDPDGRKPFANDRSAAPRPGRRERTDVVQDAAVQGTGGDERIAKRLARAGVASRRDAEDLIAAGRVKVNGKVLASPAVNVSPTDRIELDDKEIPAVERTRLFLFHKPAGVVTTNRDPQERRTVFDILPPGLPRLMTVGRLDINTEGLLLLTNDGGLSRVLELPATGWLRRYRVRVHGKVEPEKLESLKEGIAVDGVFYGAIEATLDREQGSNAWLMVGLREGKNREVKNVLGALGLDVTRLIRVSYGPFQLGELAEGEVRELKGRLLRDQLGERLIAEAGANFDAPVLNEFSSKPVAARPERPERRAADQGERPNRKREREERREDALGRLQTRKPARPGKDGRPARDARPGKDARGAPDDKPKGRTERPLEGPRSRRSNVWMAPGARPLGEKKAAALAERSEGRRYAGKPRPAGGGKTPRDGDAGPGKPRGGHSGPRKPRGKG